MRRTHHPYILSLMAPIFLAVILIGSWIDQEKAAQTKALQEFFKVAARELKRNPR